MKFSYYYLRKPVRILYCVIAYLLVPFVLLRLLWRSRELPEYRRRWNERFARGYKQNPKGGLWLHAASVGEVMAAVPLIRQFQQNYPDWPITITTITPTGSQQVKSIFGDEVFHVYVPYDIPTVVNRFLSRIQPQIAIFMETELWPNILHACGRRQIRVLIANARLSPKSVKGYRRFLLITQAMFANIDIVAAQTAMEAKHFACLGFPENKLQITGNVKFDIQLPDNLLTDGLQLRQAWGVHRRVWIAASTHEGEDEIIIEAHRKVLDKSPDSMLIIVPRHPQRFQRVKQLCQEAGFITHSRTDTTPIHPSIQVFVGDTMGELLLFYATADIAFVGGSLISQGGHNVLEPAAIGLPCLTGPHVFNFVKANQLLHQAGTLFTVYNANELADRVGELLHDIPCCAKIGERARLVIEQNRGAVKRHMDIIDGLVQKNNFVDDNHEFNEDDLELACE